MIEFIYWGACLFRILSFVTLVLLNSKEPSQKKTLSSTFFIYFFNEILLTLFIGITQLSVTILSDDPMLLAKLVIGINNLFLMIWVIIFYNKYEIDKIKKSSPLSIFILVLIWAILILISTAEYHQDTNKAMKLTTNFLIVFTTLLGIIKFFPQIYLSYSFKTKSELPLPFIICQTGFYLLFGIFIIVNSQNIFLTVIGIINICFGATSPLTLIVQNIFYTRKRKNEQKNQIQQSLNKNAINSQQDLPKKYAPSTTIYSSESLGLQ